MLAGANVLGLNILKNNDFAVRELNKAVKPVLVIDPFDKKIA